jgi:hypothetical protein
MRLAERGDDVGRLVRSAGLQQFPYRAFGNRPVRPAPAAELPRPLAAEMPAEACAAAADDPAPSMPIPWADALPASPMPEPEPARTRAAPSFSLLRQAMAAGANPATQPAPRARPAPFTLLPTSNALPGP